MGHNVSLGKWGEAIAAAHLQNTGYDVIARNWKSPYGEIDVIARKNGILTFVEVKTRSGKSYGWPEEAITPRKQEHLINSAQTYLDGLPDASTLNWQIDVISILVEDIPSGKFELNHIENAVSDQ